MLISAVPFVWVLIWAVLATFFYYLVFRKELGTNPWTYLGIFALNMVFFGWAIIVLVIIGWVRWHFRKKRNNTTEN